MELDQYSSIYPRRTYEVRLARTQREIEAAQRLRYKVFNLDQGLGLNDSHLTAMDQDPFDHWCDHLVVVRAEDQAVVGTYRLLPPHRVPTFGFYSETEFDLHRVKSSGLRLLELGRSCVDPALRTGRVIDLLFRGLGEYIRRHSIQGLMGCASVHGRNVAELQQIWAFLEAHGCLAPPESRVEPHSSHEIPGACARVFELDPTLEERLPPLFRAYLRLGAKVCGPPAWDAEFGTTDFFILVNLTRLTDAYARRFLAA